MSQAQFFRSPCSVCGGKSTTFNVKYGNWRCETHKVGRTSFFGLDVEQLKKEHSYCQRCGNVRKTRTCKVMSKDKKMPKLVDIELCYTCKRR